MILPLIRFMSSPTPAISVVIPVRNGGELFRRCLASLFAQQVEKDFELVVIDSGSTDGTWEFLARLPVRRLHVAPETFDHGLTRNVAVSEARGDIIVCTVADAIPVGDRWLATLIAPLQENNDVVAVGGKQIVPHDTAMDPLRWFRPDQPLTPNREQFSATSWKAASPARRRAAAGLDNVTTAYRGSVLRARPFVATDFGEDLEWGRWALSQGHTLVFEPRAQVAHYHAFTPDFVYRRTFRELLGEWELFDLVPEPLSWWRQIVRPLLGLWLKRPEISLPDRARWSAHHWINQRARARAIRDFRRELAKGREALWAAQRRINPSVPQGNRNSAPHAAATR